MRKLIVGFGLIVLVGFAGPAASAGVTKHLLNDTGAAICYSPTTTQVVPCAGTGEDGEFGRDVTVNVPKDGDLGFRFAKICNSGDLAGRGVCGADPVLGPAPGDWGCTRDLVTDFMWEVKTTDGGLRDVNRTFTNLRPDQKGYGGDADATGLINQVNQVGLCGQTDWRLPTYSELHSIMHYGVPYPGATIEPHYFPNTLSDLYWTSTAYAPRHDDAWYGLFQIGLISSDGRLGSYHVRLVRSVSAAAGRRFVVSEDGTEVTDNLTQLVWRRCPEGMAFDGTTCAGNSGNFTWADALATANAAGAGWRLPNIKELSSIVDPTRQNPAIDPVAFPRTIPVYFWSSTPNANTPDFAWVVFFQYGQVGYIFHSLKVRVRLVRDAP